MNSAFHLQFMSHHLLQLHPQKHTTMRNFSTFLLIFAVFCYIEGQATIPDFCNLPQDEGIESGKDVQVYLYYDKTADKCYPFRYKGEGGNENRFNYEFYCMRNCSPNAEELYPIDRTKACHLPKVIGICYGHYLRYYYDAAHGTCSTFAWTGCVGNGNRFLNFEQCNATCFGIIDDNGGNDDDVHMESDTPIGIILGVILGVIGAIILIVVLVLTLKKPTKSRKTNAKKVKEEPNTSGPEIPLQTA